MITDNVAMIDELRWFGLWQFVEGFLLLDIYREQEWA